MSWKKTFITINSTVKRYEREAQKERNAQLRELKKQEKMLLIMQAAQEKQDELECSQNEVEAFEAYIKELVSLHKIELSKINWEEIKNALPPTHPVMMYPCKDEAIKKYKTFKPSFFQKLFNRTPKIKAALKQEIKQAEKEDHSNHQQAIKDFQQSHQEWEQDALLASRILCTNEDACKEIINRVGAFAAYSSESAINLNFDKELHVFIYMNGQEAIPTETKILLKRGDVSIKPMPKTKYYELYQGHVCSIALRSAKEVFAFLPFDKVAVTVFDRLLDRSTGHLENQPVLSVLIPETSINKLNLNALDPSEALKNFTHHINFKKTSGFAPVSILEHGIKVD